jgi:hypothetical protein
MFCPDCGSAVLHQQRDDWNDLTYDWCDCGWNNRPTIEEYIERLRAAVASGVFDDDPLAKEYYTEELAGWDNDW